MDTVGTFPGLELYFRMIGQGMAFGGHPFGRRFEYRVHDDLLYAAPAERFTVEVFEPNGTLDMVFPETHQYVVAYGLEAVAAPQPVSQNRGERRALLSPGRTPGVV